MKTTCCPRCEVTLFRDEVTSGWCDRCGGRLPVWMMTRANETMERPIGRGERGTLATSKTAGLVASVVASVAAFILVVLHGGHV